MNIGTAIKRIRKQKGLNQLDLSEKAGITQTALSQIESGKKSPNTRTVEKISEALQIPVSLLYLLAIEDNDVPDSKKDDFQKLFPKLRDFVLDIMMPLESSMS